MSKLQLSLAMGDYDRTRPIHDGRVQIDGVDPITFLQSPEEMFFNAFRHKTCDISEISYKIDNFRFCCCLLKNSSNCAVLFLRVKSKLASFCTRARPVAY